MKWKSSTWSKNPWGMNRDPQPTKARITFIKSEKTLCIASAKYPATNPQEALKEASLNNPFFMPHPHHPIIE
jgi:hypothetical protein